MYKNRNRKGFAAFVLFIVVFGTFLTLITIGVISGAKEKEEKHKKINEQPITEIDGQKFRIYQDHLYPVVKINGKEETIIKDNE